MMKRDTKVTQQLICCIELAEKINPYPCVHISHAPTTDGKLYIHMSCKKTKNLGHCTAT